MLHFDISGNCQPIFLLRCYDKRILESLESTSFSWCYSRHEWFKAIFKPTSKLAKRKIILESSFLNASIIWAGMLTLILTNAFVFTGYIQKADYDKRLNSVYSLHCQTFSVLLIFIGRQPVKTNSFNRNMQFKHITLSFHHQKLN